MLTVNLIAVGKLKEDWLRRGLEEYRKRLEGYCRFRVTEIEEYRLPESPSPAQIAKGLEEEGKRILQKTGKGPLIALCVEGKELSSPQFARYLEQIQQTASEVDLVIGGSFGLWDGVKEKAALRLSVSPMTFPHQLARVMLCEQLYRSFQILSDGRYHK